MPQRTDRPFIDEVPRLLADRKMSLRTLAAAAQVDPGFLSKVLNAVDYKSPGPELARKVARGLGLPAGYFIEDRRATVAAFLDRNPRRLDALYDEIQDRR